MVTEAVLGAARGARRRGCAGRTPMGSGPSAFPVHKETDGERGSAALENPQPGHGRLFQPAAQFLGGHLPFFHAHSHTRDFPSSLSMDLLTVSGDCAVWHRLGPASRARLWLCSWGGLEAWGRETGAFLPSLPSPTRAFPCGGSGGEQQGWLPTS